MASVQLKLMGSACLVGPGGIVALMPKELVLLARLAVPEGRTWDRLELGRTLWPTATAAQCRNGIRNLLPLVRRHVSLTITRYAVRLEPGQLQVLVATSHEDYSGDFMSGFEDEWIIDERLRLRALACSSAIHDSRAHAYSGDLDTAIALAERAYEIDPLSDEAVAWRTEVLQQAGRSVESRAFASRASARIDASLGVLPSHPLVAAADWLMESQSPETLEFLVATAPQWDVMPLGVSLEVHRRALRIPGTSTKAKAPVEAMVLYHMSALGRSQQVIQWGTRRYRQAIVDEQFQAACRINVSLAGAHHSRGNMETALSFSHEGISLAERSGDVVSRANSRISRGIIVLHCLRYEEALSCFKEARTILGDHSPQVSDSVAILLAETLIITGRVEEGRKILQKIEATGRMAAWYDHALGNLNEAQGNWDAAEAHYRAARMNEAEYAGYSIIARAADSLGRLLATRGLPDASRRAFAEANRIRSSFGAIPSAYDEVRMQKLIIVG